MAESPWIVEVTDSNFEEQVISRSRDVPVLVDFWAEWCQPCRMLGPLLEELANEFGGAIVLAKVNADFNQNLVAHFQIEAFPTVVAVIDGQLAGRFVGVYPKAEIKAFIEKLLPTESDKLLKQALALESSNPVEAQSLLARAVESDPKNTVAAAALADLLTQAGKYDEAGTVARSVPEGADGWPRASNVLAKLEFHEAAQQAGSLDALLKKVSDQPNDARALLDLGLAQAAAGQFEAALETLVMVVEKNRDFGNEHARPAMLKVFNIVGQQSALSNRYRSRLASALY